MNIDFHQVEGHHEHAHVQNHTAKTSVSGKDHNNSAAQAAFAWDHTGNETGLLAYREQDKNNQIFDEASLYDEKNTKNYMVVMSNTLSDEDYAKLQKEGGNPADCESKDIVTIMDQIKVTLAKSGVNIAGFTDNLDAATIKETGLSDGYANAIANALSAKNLPPTEENIKAIATQLDQAQNLTELTDGAKKYLIENGLMPTLDNLYKARYAGGEQATASQGYFQAGSYGYMAKKGTADDLAAMESQIKDVIEKAGMQAEDGILDKANWLLEKGLPLTEENLHYLLDLEHMTFGMDFNRIALAAADAISIGLSAKDGNLTIGYETNEAGYINRAIEIDEQTHAVTDGDLKDVVLQGKSINLYTLFQMRNQSESTGKDSTHNQDDAMSPAQNKAFLEAKKQLVQIQLHMSAQANLKLMKHGISIDLAPLNQLADMLEKEESLYHATELHSVMEKTGEIKALPEETLGVSVKEAWMANRVYTLDHIYETGKSIALEYAKAGQSYEALMTAPRADLGDSMKKAFRNVDDLLSMNDMDITDENRKAVRILAYNRMEITKENLQAVKEADALFTKVMNQMTPEKTLHMLREGINPMNMNLDELADYLSSWQDESTQLEKYSKFLYRMEQNNEISAEEKDAYIGIYRLLRQIEKGDEAAIGTIVSNKQDLNLENLLSAVRTRKKGYIDAKVDDAFGLLKDIQKNGASISDQILNYYQNRAEQLTKEMATDGFGKDDNLTEFYQSDLENLRQMGTVPEETFTELLSDGTSVTVNFVMAEQMLSGKAPFIRDLKNLAKQKDKENEFLQELDHLTDAFDDGEEAVKEAYEAFTERAAGQLQAAGEDSGNHIDVRSYAFDMRQISLWNTHAKQENYYVPVQLSDSIAMIHVKIVNSDKKGTVAVDIKAMEEKLGKATAVFTAKDGKIEGLVGVCQEKDLETYQNIAGKCADFILEKTGKEADITCIYSQTMNLNAFRGEEKTSSTRELYQIAKAFIQSIEQEVTKYESKL